MSSKNNGMSEPAERTSGAGTPYADAVDDVAGASPRGTDTTVAVPTVAAEPDISAEPSTAPVGPVTGEPATGEPAAAGAPPTAQAGRSSRGNLVRSGSIMAIGSMFSRTTGYLRAMLLSAAIGGAAVGNAYAVSYTLPGMLYEFLLGAILSSVLVPQLVRAAERDADGGDAYTQRLLTLAVLALGAATLLVTLCAPLITAVISNDSTTSDARQLTTVLSYLMLPMIFFMGLAALLSAVLNSRSQFGAPMWVPILNNLVLIGTAVTLIMLPGPVLLTPENIPISYILVLGLGTMFGVAVQAFALWPFVRRGGFRWKWRFGFRELQLGSLGRLAAWALCYVTVSQIGVFVVLKLLKTAGDRGAAGPFVYNNAFLMFMLAHGIVAVSIMTALLPRMSKAAAADKLGELAANLSLGVRLVSVVLTPVTVAYIVLGGPIAVLLFEWGRYTHTEALRTGTVIAVAGLTVLPYAISQLQLSAYYAQTDTRTPAMINMAVVAIKVGLDLTLFFTLPVKYVAAGMMLGNTIAYASGALISALLLRRKIGRMGLGAILRTWLRLGVAAAVAAAACLGVLYLLDATTSIGSVKVASLTQLAVGGLVLLGTYIAVATALRVKELTEFWSMVRRKLGRA